MTLQHIGQDLVANAFHTIQLYPRDGSPRSAVQHWVHVVVYYCYARRVQDQNAVK